MRILVSGSRTLDDYSLVKRKLDAFTAKLDKKKLVFMLNDDTGEDEARGVNGLVSWWCYKRGVAYLIYHKNTPGETRKGIAETVDAIIAFGDCNSLWWYEVAERAEELGCEKVKRVEIE